MVSKRSYQRQGTGIQPVGSELSALENTPLGLSSSLFISRWIVFAYFFVPEGGVLACTAIITVPQLKYEL